MLKEGRLEKILSFVITGLILAGILIFGTASAVNVFVHSATNSSPVIGATIYFIAEVDINTGERIPIENLTLEINDSRNCTFYPNGTEISGNACSHITVTPINNSPIGWGYGYMWGYGFGNNVTSSVTQNTSFGTYYGYGATTNYNYTGANNFSELAYNISWVTTNYINTTYNIYLGAIANQGTNYFEYRSTSALSISLKNASTTSSSSSSSSSSGGDDDSDEDAFWTATYLINDADFTNGITKIIGQTERLKVKVNNEWHYIGVVEADEEEDTAKINVSSNPQEFTLVEDEEQKVDSDEDGYYDMLIKLINVISYEEVNISIKKINITVEEPETIGTAIPGCEPDWNCTEWSECVDGKQFRTCTDNNNCNNEEDKPKEERSCGSKIFIIIILGAVLIAFLIILFIVGLKKAKKDKYYRKGFSGKKIK